MGDNVVAVKTHGNLWKRGKSALQGFVVTKRFKKIYGSIYGAKNLLRLWCNKRRFVEINVGHCLPLPQPASPCARRSRPNEAFVLASADREMSQLENGILPLVRDTVDLSAIALHELCVA